jgi:hypothetical protein
MSAATMTRWSEAMTPSMLGLAEAAIRDLKLPVLVRGWRRTTAEEGICTPQLLDVLLQRARVQMLAHGSPAGAGL